jgi:hydroxylamine oxidation protein HaoB
VSAAVAARDRRRLAAGAALIATGLALAAAAFWRPLLTWPGSDAPRFETVPVALDQLPAEAEFAFPVTEATRLLLRDGDSEIGFLRVRYTDQAGGSRSALLPPTRAQSDDPFGSRFSWWLNTAAALRKHMPADGTVVTWWDNAQRVHLLTGRDVWIDGPTETLFGRDEHGFWKETVGAAPPGGARQQRLSQLARWFTEPADKALPEIAAAFAERPSVYLLVSTDDLARAEEFAAAGGARLPVESAVFATGENLHGAINTVRRWAQEGGTGAYMVQPLPGQRVRAWRLTDAAALDWLLVRALPFSTSLYRPLEGARLVFQSAGGSYLSVYEIRAPATGQ